MEDHANLAAEGGDVYAGGVDIAAMEGERAGDAGNGDEVVHAVDGAKEGGLAAARGANEGGDLVGGDVGGDMAEGLGGAVKEVQVFGGEDCFVRHL